MMNRPILLQRSGNGNSHRERFAKRLLLGVSFLLLSVGAQAQITQPNGSSSQDSQAMPVQPSAGTDPARMQESMKPQAKQEGSRSSAKKSSKSGKEAAGNGGFENGLYGTGAGSNK